MSTNMIQIKTCRNLIVTMFLLTNVTFAQTCFEKKTIGNNNKTEIFNKINDKAKKIRKSLAIGTLHSIKASKLSFQGCEATITFNAKLKRWWPLPNQKGRVKLKANIRSISDNRICISNVNIISFFLSPSWGIERTTYRTLGQPFLRQATGCMYY